MSNLIALQILFNANSSYFVKSRQSAANYGADSIKKTISLKKRAIGKRIKYRSATA